MWLFEDKQHIDSVEFVLWDNGEWLLHEELKTKSSWTDNGITVEGTKKLCEVLKDTVILSTLYFFGNKIEEEGVKMIDDSLKNNSSLTELCIGRDTMKNEMCTIPFEDII